MSKLTIINLDNPTDEAFELHATGCSDIAKKKGYTVEVANRQEVIDYIDGDDLGYTIEDHVKVYPCAQEGARA